MRYILLVLLNLPVVLIAILSLVTNYKMHKVDKRRFYVQLLMWLVIIAVVTGSYPVYNALTGNPPFQSDTLSFLDIVQTTLIIYLLYIVSKQRQRIDHASERLRDFHQEASILLSKEHTKP